MISRRQRARSVLLSALLALGVSRLCNAQATLRAPTDTATAALRVFFIGDAGGALPNPVLSALSRELGDQRGPSYVVFLGDNVYPLGIPPAGNSRRTDAETRLRAQIDAVRSAGANAIFVPGNHDWGSVNAPDNSQLLRQAEIVLSTGDDRIAMRPNLGCPGPDVVDVASQIRIIVLDTEWWIREPGSRHVDTHCVVSERAVLDSLARLMANAPVNRVIVVGHHPLQSVGPHGGHHSLRDHLFPLPWRKAAWVPLPIAGSIYLASRTFLKVPQDLHAERYTSFRTQLDSLFHIYHPLIYASGHEHNLQVFRSTGAQLMLISGGGGEPPRSTGSASNLMMAKQANGFMRLDLHDNGSAQLTVLSVNKQAQTSVLYSAEVKR